MNIAFLLYPTAGIQVSEDTSFWIMHELLQRGHQVFHFESRHLLWRSDSPHAFLAKSRTHLKKRVSALTLQPRTAGSGPDGLCLHSQRAAV